MVILGVPIALLAACVLALGAQLQNRGVSAVDEGEDGESRSGFSLRQLGALARTPKWLGGTSLLTLAIALQLVSLALAPLAVVQPLGALSLVVTAFLDRWMNKAHTGRAAFQAIALCVVGVTVFVTTAAFTTRSSPSSPGEIIAVLGILAAVLVLFGVLFAVLRHRRSSLVFALGAGVLFGFVATLAKIVLGRIGALLGGSVLAPQDWLTLLCIAGLAGAGAFGLYLVQTAYAAGSPDLVVAALTVIDPLIAVTIGITVLGEARGAPPWVFPVFVVAEAVAVAGVLRLARHAPEPQREEQEAQPTQPVDRPGRIEPRGGTESG